MRSFAGGDYQDGDWFFLMWRVGVFACEVLERVDAMLPMDP
jgi:hypothetical protein